LAAAAWGAGDTTMPLAAGGHLGAPDQELTLLVGLRALSVAMFGSCFLVLWGLLGEGPFTGHQDFLKRRYGVVLLLADDLVTASPSASSNFLVSSALRYLESVRAQTKQIHFTVRCQANDRERSRSFSPNSGCEQPK
jgi:hypothetical protein